MSHPTPTTRWILALALSLSAAAPPPAAAEAPQAPGPVRAIEGPELARFADAYLQVHRIVQGLQAKLQGVGDDAEAAMALRKQASQAMTAAVQGEDFEVPRYNHIARKVQADEALRGRVAKLVRARLPEADGAGD